MTPRSQLTAPLDVLVECVHGAVPPAIADARRDFSRVLARARAMGFVAVEQGCSQVIDIRSVRHADAEPHDALLDPLVLAARAALARTIEARRAQPIPALRPRARRGWPLVAAVTLAAAAVVAVLGGIVTDESVREAGPAPAPTQAHHQRGVDAADALVQRREVASMPPRVASSTRTVVQPAVAPASTAAPSMRARPRAAVPANRARELGDRAAAAWRAGDRELAESLYLEVTRVAGRSMLAELAWGDLFALAAQRGDTVILAKRWRGYLRAFPRGRYVDDARAGLCRTAAEPSSCWERYLVELPRGSYRAEAERARLDPHR